MTDVSIKSPAYTRTAIFLHWAIALLIVANVLLALSVAYLPPGYERAIIDLHKSLGLTVLALAAIRLFWRAGHTPPPLPPGIPAYEHLAAHATHMLLYIVMIALPLSGWIHDSAWAGAATHPLRLFGFIPWFRLPFIAALPPEPREHIHTLFGAIHVWCGYALYILLSLHVLGVIKHVTFDRINLLRRMMPRR